jgi:DNA helicase HerA-like ATPase
LPATNRFKHQYVLGKTGSGKSVLLRYKIAHALNAGHGVVVVIPERDLINDVAYVPDSRIDDVVYFDASDDASPFVGFNPFNLPEKSLLTQRTGELESILIRTMGDMGVKMKPILSNSIYALLATQGSFHDIPKLINPNDSNYRRSIASKLEERTRDFFQKYDTSKYYKEVFEPIINRLEPLLRPPPLQTASLNFNQLLNHTPSIVLCDLSRLRGFQAETVGQLLLAIFKQTFFARDSITEEKRRPYFFNMNEFQMYVTGSEHSLKDF